MSRIEEAPLDHAGVQSSRLQNFSYMLSHLSGDDMFEVLSNVFACTAVVIIALTGIVLVRGSIPVLGKFGLGFLTGSGWSTTFGQESYGMLPYVLGTLVTSGIAISIGIPVSLGIAIFLAEMAPTSVRVPLSQLVELLTFGNIRSSDFGVGEGRGRNDGRHNGNWRSSR